MRFENHTIEIMLIIVNTMMMLKLMAVMNPKTDYVTLSYSDDGEKQQQRNQQILHCDSLNVRILLEVHIKHGVSKHGRHCLVFI